MVLPQEVRRQMKYWILYRNIKQNKDCEGKHVCVVSTDIINIQQCLVLEVLEEMGEHGDVGGGIPTIY